MGVWAAFMEGSIVEHELKIAMKEYLGAVDTVCYNLLEGLNLKNKFDFYEYRKAHKLTEFEVNGIKYRLHGRGCIAFNEEIFVDWDFGYRSRWCGIDPWLFATTLKENKSAHSIFYDGELVKQVCEQAVIDGEMFKMYDQYYFAIPLNETFKPDFPKLFDTLIIEHFDKKRKIPRNKTVDRFLRKSTKIYIGNDKNLNPYMLRFILDGKEIFSIHYDDIGYPENAIRVMDNILREYQPE